MRYILPFFLCFPATNLIHALSPIAGLDSSSLITLRLQQDPRRYIPVIHKPNATSKTHHKRSLKRPAPSNARPAVVKAIPKSVASSEPVKRIESKSKVQKTAPKPDICRAGGKIQRRGQCLSQLKQSHRQGTANHSQGPNSQARGGNSNSQTSRNTPSPSRQNPVTNNVSSTLARQQTQSPTPQGSNSAISPPTQHVRQDSGRTERSSQSSSSSGRTERSSHSSSYSSSTLSQVSGFTDEQSPRGRSPVRQGGGDQRSQRRPTNRARTESPRRATKAQPRSKSQGPLGRDPDPARSAAQATWRHGIIPPSQSILMLSDGEGVVRGAFPSTPRRYIHQGYPNLPVHDVVQHRFQTNVEAIGHQRPERYLGANQGTLILGQARGDVAQVRIATGDLGRGAIMLQGGGQDSIQYIRSHQSVQGTVRTPAKGIQQVTATGVVHGPGEVLVGSINLV